MRRDVTHSGFKTINLIIQIFP